MGYYQLPTGFIVSLLIASFLKTSVLRLCESVAIDESITVFHVLFFSFVISCGLSLSAIFSCGKKNAWSYKLIALIGGRENPPKLGAALFGGILYIVHLGGLIIGSFLTSPLRAIMLVEYLLTWFQSSTSSTKNHRVLRFIVAIIPVFACIFFDYKNLSETTLGEYVKAEILPELGIATDVEAGAKLSRPFHILLVGYLCLFASVIAQLGARWVTGPSVLSSLTTTAIGRKAVNNQIKFFSFTQAMAALLMVPWIINNGGILFPDAVTTLLLYLGLAVSAVILDWINYRGQYSLGTYQNSPCINWAAPVIGSSLYSLFTSSASDPKQFSSVVNLILVVVFFLSLLVVQPPPKEKSGDLKPFLGLEEKASFSDTLTYFVGEILASQDSRQIFYFLLLNLSYMFVQLLYGFWTNSLGLISDAIHMFFDCVALGVGLFAAVTGKWPRNKTFSYGYSRIEVLSGFANGIFLALISLFIVLEAIGRLIHPPEMNTDRLLLVSFMGLVVNLIGILAFNHGQHGHCHHSHGASPQEPLHEHISIPDHNTSHVHTHGHDHSHSHNHHVHENTHQHSHAHEHDHKHHHIHTNGHSHSHNHNHSHNHSHSNGCNESHSHEHSHGHSHDHSHSHGHGHSHNMEGVFLHILADTLGSVGVIISTLLIKYFGWTGFDPLASIFIAVLIFFSVLPLIKSSLSILMLYVPPATSSRFLNVAKQAELALGEGYCVLDGKIWPNDHGVYVATLCIGVHPSTNPSLATSTVKKIFSDSMPSIKDLSIQLESIKQG